SRMCFLLPGFDRKLDCHGLFNLVASLSMGGGPPHLLRPIAVRPRDAELSFAPPAASQSAECAAHFPPGRANSLSSIWSRKRCSVISISTNFLPSWWTTTFIGTLTPSTSL